MGTLAAGTLRSVIWESLVDSLAEIRRRARAVRLKLVQPVVVPDVDQTAPGARELAKERAPHAVASAASKSLIPGPELLALLHAHFVSAAERQAAPATASGMGARHATEAEK